MPSLIKMTEEQHKARLQQRHRTGAIFANLFRVALVVAVVALVTLIVDVVDEAFGTVLVAFAIEPETLADQPLEELNEIQLGTILMQNLNEGAFITLIRENIGTITDASFVSEPISISLSGRRFPDSLESVDRNTTLIRDLSPEQQRDILIANSSRAQLLSWVNTEVVGLEVLDSWTFGDTLFRRDSIYTAAAESQSNDVVERALDAAGSINASDEQLIAAFAPMIGEDKAISLVGDLAFAITVINRTDDQTGNNRWVQQAQEEVRAAFADTPPDQLSEDRVRDEVTDSIAAAIANDLAIEIEPSAAQAVGDEFAPAIVRETFDSFDDSETEDLLTILVHPPLALAIERGTYTDARLEFRSWLNQSFLTARGRNSIPAQASLRTAILGSVWVMIITISTAFPLGVGAAIYLEEYASDNWLNRIIETNIRNLAGVPSIIYGILGLAIFVRALAPLTSGQAFGFGGGGGTNVIGTVALSVVLSLVASIGILYAVGRDDSSVLAKMDADTRREREAAFRRRLLSLSPVLFIVIFPVTFVLLSIVFSALGGDSVTGETLNG
ncbi:MAG: hypothetical protein AAF653_01985, partial [Chloroflexota bacterium]